MDNWLKRKAAPASVPLEKSLIAGSSCTSPKRQSKKVAFAAVPSSSDAPLPKATFLPPNSLHLILPVDKSKIRGQSGNSILRSQLVSSSAKASVLSLKSSMTVTRDASTGGKPKGVDEIRNVIPLGSATKPSTSLAKVSLVSCMKPITKEHNVVLSTSNSSTIILTSNQNYRPDSEISVLSSILSIPSKMGKLVSIDATANSSIGISVPLITSVSSKINNKTKVAVARTETEKKMDVKDLSINPLNSVPSPTKSNYEGLINRFSQEEVQLSESRSLALKSERVDLTTDVRTVLPLSPPFSLSLSAPLPIPLCLSQSINSNSKHSGYLLDTGEKINLIVLPTENCENMIKLNEIVEVTVEIGKRGGEDDEIKKNPDDDKTGRGSTGLEEKGSGVGTGLEEKGIGVGTGLEEKGIGVGTGLEEKGIGVGTGPEEKGVGVGVGVGVGTVAKSAPEEMEIAVTVKDKIRTFFSNSHSEPSSENSLSIGISSKTNPTKKEFIQDLVTLRQDTMDAFVLAGFVRTKEMYASSRSGPLPFIRDPSMFGGPMSVLNMSCKV